MELNKEPGEDPEPCPTAHYHSPTAAERPWCRLTAATELLQARVPSRAHWAPAVVCVGWGGAGWGEGCGCLDFVLVLSSHPHSTPN